MIRSIVAYLLAFGAGAVAASSVPLWVQGVVLALTVAAHAGLTLSAIPDERATGWRR